ncbi:MAG: DUF4258 domain-containing protein [Lachnospiraceae bacterium]|nr:DUF4258 domain-containing protein [Lachnospiraceae bacterium]
MSKEEFFVRNAYERGMLTFSLHAYDKMRKLKITESQVLNCIKTGILVEQQNGYENEDPRMIFYNGHHDSFYVVVTVASLDHVVVTVCETDFTKWKKKGDGIERIN